MKEKRFFCGLLPVLISGMTFGLLPGAVTICYKLGATRETMLVGRYLVLILVLLTLIFSIVHFVINDMGRSFSLFQTKF